MDWDLAPNFFEPGGSYVVVRDYLRFFFDDLELFFDDEALVSLDLDLDFETFDLLFESLGTTSFWPG